MAVRRAVLLVASLALARASEPGAPVLTLIRGGTVVNADRSVVADVLLTTAAGGSILAVGPGLEAPPSARVLDATGLLVIPGGVDTHTHFAMPFMGTVTADDFWSGHRAALAGGTTTHLDFALPVGGNLSAGVDAWLAKAQAGCLDYSLHSAITHGAWGPHTAAQMAAEVARGVTSFKFFLAYKGTMMVTDDVLLAGMAAAKALGALPMVHAENGEAVEAGRAAVFASGVTGPEGHALSRPHWVETEATVRSIALARTTGAPLYVVHVMAAEAAAAVAAARARGQRVVGEAVLAGIALDGSAAADPDYTRAAAAVMSPPIRAYDVDGAALRGGLAGGSLSVLATDHCAFNSTQKAAGVGDFRLIPNGVTGVGERLVVAWHELVAKPRAPGGAGGGGGATQEEWVRATSTAAAHAFGLYPRKGLVAPGADADVVLFDPEGSTRVSAATHLTRADVSPYEGRLFSGAVTHTLSRGRLVWERDGGGGAVCDPGTARFLPRDPFAPTLYPGGRGKAAGAGGRSGAGAAAAGAVEEAAARDGSEL